MGFIADLLVILFWIITEFFPIILAFLVLFLLFRNSRKHFIGPTQSQLKYYKSITKTLKKNPNAYTLEELDEINKKLDEDIRNIEEKRRIAGAVIGRLFFLALQQRVERVHGALFLRCQFRLDAPRLF